MFVKREGVFYGQCSELCGDNHGFMPIVVQAVSQDGSGTVCTAIGCTYLMPVAPNC
ncbi:cytochrome c oxidase subunit 2 [Ectocarpus siliculosus]|uniref:Cytochrome c oxidase polypeptide II n=1 Tax=Ectocarpus siliculosus TaxID=2880 RepID=D7FGY5_ECTSI|nr:cytochrome c oxidase subunit 2 [Ectocarpus siliculosus]|eukprot:CBJ34114.1 cytochrome c oxidase subunit 2 [Ectocarpus siliculosus]